MSINDDIDTVVETMNKIKTRVSTMMIPQPVPMLSTEWLSFLSKIKIVVHGQTEYTRYVDFTSPYVKLFHSEQVRPDLSMMLIGIEDTDDGNKPDGWTDILLPIFYGPAPNACLLVDEPMFFVDAAFSGGYKKEFYFYTQGQWKLLYTYSVQDGLCLYGGNIKVSVGYIEYSQRLDKLCNL